MADDKADIAKVVEHKPIRSARESREFLGITKAEQDRRAEMAFAEMKAARSRRGEG